MTFFIEVIDNNIYSKIMETMISRSLTHSKDELRTGSGGFRMEIQGKVEDFKFFEKQIEEMNAGKLYPGARIIEGI